MGIYVYDGEKNCFFFISPVGSKHRITKVLLIANGVRDACITKDMRVRKITETAPELILFTPKGDILCLTIDPPFQDKCTIIQDIGDDPERMTKFVKHLIKTGVPEKIGKDYHMYGGNNYW